MRGKRFVRPILLKYYFSSFDSGGGDRRAGDREKRGREVYGRREKRGREAGEKGKNYATLCNISQSKKCKGREPKNTGWEPGLKGTGSGRFKPPCPPHSII